MNVDNVFSLSDIVKKLGCILTQHGFNNITASFRKIRDSAKDESYYDQMKIIHEIAFELQFYAGNYLNVYMQWHKKELINNIFLRTFFVAYFDTMYRLYENCANFFNVKFDLQSKRHGSLRKKFDLLEKKCPSVFQDLNQELLELNDMYLRASKIRDEFAHGYNEKGYNKTSRVEYRGQDLYYEFREDWDQEKYLEEIKLQYCYLSKLCGLINKLIDSKN